ncbi:MAG: CoB--CoM heterodisulfide reductase iron-sulfur subunit B family protein [Promethearchaeota archaeon]
MEKSLFLGCTIPGRIPFVEKSAKLVCDDLGITTEVPKGYACCPDPVGIGALDEKTWLAMAARNLCVAEAGNKPVMALCTGCAMTLKTANHILKHSEFKKNKVNGYLSKINKEYKGSLDDIKHFAQIVYDEIGVGKVKELVKRPLNGLKVALHYGCHFLRPSNVIKFDDPFHPSKVDEIVKACGAESIDYKEKLLCCGHGVSIHSEEIAAKMNKRKFASALNAGVHVFCVLCPSCYLRLENGQRSVKKMFGMEVKIPILYLTDLMALAFGHSGDEIGLKNHRPNPAKLLAEIGIQV